MANFLKEFFFISTIFLKYKHLNGGYHKTLTYLFKHKLNTEEQ